MILYLGGGFQPGSRMLSRGLPARLSTFWTGSRCSRVPKHTRMATLEQNEGHEGEEHGADPHVWLDPVLYARIVERIGEVLGRTEQARQLADELRALDEELGQGLADCDRRTLVTSHAAFGYLAARYGLEQIGVTGLSPEAEPSPRDLEEIVEHVRESGATTIFFETLVSPELAEAVARETGATTAVLNPLEGLTPEESEAGEDYFSIMRRNLAAVREGLGCR